MIEELYYAEQSQQQQLSTDKPRTEEVTKRRWLQLAYGDELCKRESKVQLLKLVEYNKIMIIENDLFLVQYTEIEVTMCKLMK